MSMRTFLIWFVLIAAAARVSAQVSMPPVTAGMWEKMPQGGVFVGGVAGPNVDMIAVEPFDTGKPVIGAPFSAVAVTEVTQALADGNRIEHRTSVAMYRDGEGRVRREQQSMALGPLVAQSEMPMVTITDPVNGGHLMLDLKRRTAFRAKLPIFETAVPAQVMTFRESVGVAARRVPGGASADTDASVRTEQLEAQDVEGVRAEGTRTTVTIPAGAVGNQLPIEAVSERWYSPELQMVVMTRRSDPRFGETIYRLTNIVRAEPPADLFQVPADFTTTGPESEPIMRQKMRAK